MSSTNSLLLTNFDRKFEQTHAFIHRGHFPPLGPIVITTSIIFSSPTDSFTTHDVPELYKICQSPYLEALMHLKGPVGSQQQPFIITCFSRLIYRQIGRGQKIVMFFESFFSVKGELVKIKGVIIVTSSIITDLG